MRKSALLVVTILVLALAFSVGTTTALAKGQAKGKGKIVFVHYRGGNPIASNLAANKASLTGDQVGDYKYTGIHWPSTAFPVHYTIDPANPNGLVAETVQATVDASFATWEDADAGGNVVVDFMGDGFASVLVNPLNTSDGNNTICWRPLSSSYPGAIGITVTWYHYAGKRDKIIDECDTILNSDYPWSINIPGTTGFASFDVQNIMTHELGHWLLLGDLYSKRDSELTMYGYGSTGETKKDTLGRGDVLGINAIYP